jgi:hypothetical protein
VTVRKGPEGGFLFDSQDHKQPSHLLSTIRRYSSGLLEIRDKRSVTEIRDRRNNPQVTTATTGSPET